MTSSQPPEPPRQDDTVGYCNPPKHSRFRPGQSGNPRGRPRRKLALNDVVEDIATTQVSVSVDGRMRKMPALSAILLLQVRKALQGDYRACRFVIETFERRGLGGAIKGSQDDMATWAEGARERLAEKIDKMLAGADYQPPSLDPATTPARSS